MVQQFLFSEHVRYVQFCTVQALLSLSAVFFGAAVGTFMFFPASCWIFKQEFLRMNMRNKQHKHRCTPLRALQEMLPR